MCWFFAKQRRFSKLTFCTWRLPPVCFQNAACTSHDIPVPEELHQSRQWVFRCYVSPLEKEDRLSCNGKLFEGTHIKNKNKKQTVIRLLRIQNRNHPRSNSYKNCWVGESVSNYWFVIGLSWNPHESFNEWIELERFFFHFSDRDYYYIYIFLALLLPPT